MQKVLILGLLVAFVLSACSTAQNEQQVQEEGQSPVVTVYRPPT